MIKSKLSLRTGIFSLLIVLISIGLSYGQSNYYFPEKGDKWLEKSPVEFGINEAKLKLAVEFALNNEYSGSKDLRQAILKGFEYEPYHTILGPTKKRGGPAGMILKNGYIIAQWGDIKRVDMTFSVTKSYLSTVAGLAYDNKLIKSLNDPVFNYVWDGSFQGEHNEKINWEHLLNQSSDWSGTLWGGHDWADRPPREGTIDDWKTRELKEPGSVFEYNDVRVNLLAYSLLQVWRKPLPVVLKEKIMDPIGASSTWRWYGYDNSWVTIDGMQVQSVSGGGHSGGGLFISAEDHARFGLLFLNNGKWNNQQLITESWIEKATSPSQANINYGYMWWLNKQGPRHWEGISESVFYAAGFGGNYIVIDQENDLLVVTRWLEPSKLGEFMQIVKGALNK
ncbi:MAG: beta-lactamase family protein [Bacteroidales bacterium]|nr:beta-lactamase family protein [Bacteroidales bacterium]